MPAEQRHRRRGALPFGVVRERLAPFSPHSGRRLSALVVLAVLGTLAETVALVLVARTAVALTAGQERLGLGAGLETGRGGALLLAGAALVVRLALSTGSAWVAARLASETVRAGRLALLDAYFRTDWNTQSRERMGELQDYLTSTVGRLNGVNQAFSNGLNALVGFVVVVVAAVLVNPLAALGCVLATGVVLLVLRPVARLTKRYSWAQSDATRVLATGVTEAVRVTQEVRVFGTRAAVVQRLDEAEERTSRPLLMANFTSSLAPAAYQVMAIGFLVVAVGALELVGATEVDSLGAAVLLLLRGLSYGQQLQAALQNLAGSVPFLDALHERKAVYDARRERSGTCELAHVGDLVLRGVGFAYDSDAGGDGAGREVLHDLHVRLGRSEAIGVVGPSGSGKSTLLQLLLRLRRPTTGTIEVDGVDLWDVTAESWSERVAFVPQDARLLDGTVSENIRFFRDVSQERVEQAARLAHVHDDVVSWSAGYDTRVGESGHRVSGGQRQRIAIARALVTEPDLLVLDEPTSALDLLSEARLQETLHDLAGRVGLIIVAHRLSTLKHCTRVLVLHDGRVEGFDEHSRLLETSAFYRDAVALSLLGPTGAVPVAAEPL